MIGTGRKKTKYKMDLIPPALIVARYFADDQAHVDELNAKAEASNAGRRGVRRGALRSRKVCSPSAMDDDKINKTLATSSPDGGQGRSRSRS